MESAAPKTNLLLELAKRKAEAKKSNVSFGFFNGKKKPGKFGKPENAKSSIPRGGRNGNGKPS